MHESMNIKLNVYFKLHSSPLISVIYFYMNSFLHFDVKDSLLKFVQEF